MQITLPKRMREKLQTDPARLADVVNLITAVSPYYSLSPCFFPDYTIHGIDHVNVVLDLADRLIPEETMSLLSGREAAILAAAVILHDIGMFLTEDGLNSLLSGEYAGHKVDGLDGEVWREAWIAYQQKIKRCSDRELFRAFGESAPVDFVCTDRSKMRRKDYLVCGEFIRRQHPRLAHEIALHGFMGSKSTNLFQTTGFTQEEKNLIGLIARSHGMSLRDTEPYLANQFYDIALPLNLHLFYLMAVLRIADYLDAGQHRAPKVLEDRQAIEVPISQGEWLWNRTVRCEDYLWCPESMSLVIQANPDTTSLFVKNETWLRQVQQELDLSWAVLLERYPRQDFRLSIHRIESNILHAKTRNALNRRFLTREAKLTANPDLSKLLIRPLYGNDPSFGVRELLQNAVDACNEREHLEPEGSYHGEVKISLDTVEKTITVADNGLGMNEDVLLHYFLSAGSSYRCSDSWLADFADGREAQVVRSGRFGVGVLSVFLLGASVYVRTRYLRDDLGYEFSFTIEQESIDVRRVDCEVGTTIVVKLSDETLKELQDEDYSGEIEWYEWYAFREPRVRYYIDGEEVHKKRRIVPRRDEENPGWLSYRSSDYESYQWRYDNEKIIYCNGIAIKSSNILWMGQDTGLRVEVPSISVVDKMARLPIDLSRSTVFEVPDREGLIREVYRYQLAKLLLTPWDTDKKKRQNLRSGFLPNQRWLRNTIIHIFSPKGFSLNAETFLRAAGIDRWLEFGFNSNTPTQSINITRVKSPSGFKVLSRDPMDINYRSISFYGASDLRCRALRIWVGPGELDAARRNVGQLPWEYQEQPACAGYHCFELKEACPSDPLLPRANLDPLAPKLFPIAAEYQLVQLEDAEIPEEDNIMLQMIRHYLGDDIWVPFDMEERKRKFPKAFEELRYYMEKIENEQRRQDAARRRAKSK